MSDDKFAKYKVDFIINTPTVNEFLFETSSFALSFLFFFKEEKTFVGGSAKRR